MDSFNFVNSCIVPNITNEHPSKDVYFLALAQLSATRGTCGRRRVGCIFVDKNHHVLATGYNGVAAGLDHCTDSPCPGCGAPSGESLHLRFDDDIQITF